MLIECLVTAMYTITSDKSLAGSFVAHIIWILSLLYSHQCQDVEGLPYLQETKTIHEKSCENHSPRLLSVIQLWYILS